VLVAGAGVAGLEAVLALRDLAGERVCIQLLAPEPEFVYRPLRVREPFAYGVAERYPIAQLVHGLGVELLAERRASRSDQPLWSPPRKIVGKYLGPHLERIESR
jgi:sulfide:quinone oxidoreductase